MNFVILFISLMSILVIIYLGKRWLFWLDFHLNGYLKLAYWLALATIATTFILSKVLNDFPAFFGILFSLTICFVYATLLFDFIHLISRRRFKPDFWVSYVYVGCVIVLFIFGHQMATNSKIVNYQVTINKQANVDHLRIVQLSDIHLNGLTQRKFIKQMVDEVNKLNADLIVITGDTLDKQLKSFTETDFNKQFSQLKSKYGTYIIFGNHEYLAINKEHPHGEDIVDAFKAANMRVLRDDIVYLSDLNITLIGREDFSSSKYDLKRAELADLMMFADTSTPIILLDHQPKNLDETANAGVDLMISGHTHGGQLFPINLLLSVIYKNADGIYHDTEKQFTSIVSSGYGFGSIPLRLMTRSEIVVIDVTFDNNKEQSNHSLE